jgi:iron complex outermembrane receptor protein
MHRIFSPFLATMCLVLLCAAEVTAGSIRGTVTGAVGPIAGAAVRVLELDRIARTGADGGFLFLDVRSGRYTVFVRVIGYASQAIPVRLEGETTDLTFRLRESAIEAEEIVVSGSPYERTADDQYQSAESKSLVDLHTSPGSSFSEKISDLPGVAVRSNGSAPARPVLRGLSDNRVLVLENGLRTGDISTYDPAHAVPIEAPGISQIDVIRGPATILYGPSTIGGLVNVFTNTIPVPSASPFRGSVSLTGNSVSDEYAGYFNGVVSTGGHAVGISAAGLHSQNIRIPGGNYTDRGSGRTFFLDRMPQSFNHVQEAGIGYSYQGDFGTIGIGGKHYEMNYGIPGVPPNPDWADVPPATSRIAQKKNALEVRGLLEVDGSLIHQVRFNAGYADYNHSEFPTEQDSTGISAPQANHFRKQAVNATLQFQHERFGNFQGIVGFWTDIENLRIDGDMPLGPNSLTTGFAGYVYEEYLAGDDTRLQAGFRFDYNRIQTSPFGGSPDSVFRTLDVTRLSNAVTASLGAVRKLSSGTSFSVSVARSFRAPTVQELFANGLDAASSTYSKGWADLSPETGFGTDASFKARTSIVVFEFSPYLNFIHSYIYAFLTGDTLEDFPVRQFSATDARLTGFEASITIQTIDKIAVRGSVDYVNAEDTKNSVPLPFTPPLRGILSVRYQDASYSGVVEWRLAARQTRLGEGDTPTAGYGIVNCGAGVRLSSGGLVHELSVHCDNLFNRVYRDNLSVIKDFIPQPARSFRLAYDLLF